MENAAEAKKLLPNSTGSLFNERAMNVNIARPRKSLAGNRLAVGEAAGIAVIARQPRTGGDKGGKRRTW
jgi:hypothetical protein